MGDWYSKGFDKAEEQIASTNTFTREFFLKGDEEAIIRILDEEPLNLRDHFVNGKGFFTCTGDDDCAFCEKGIKAGNHFVFQVVDTREYTARDGKVYKDQIKIWRVGTKVLRLLKKRASRSGPLNSYFINVSKIGTGQSSTWDIEVLTDTIGKSFELTKDQERYDLMEVLRPKTRAEAIGILNGTEVEEAKSDSPRGVSPKDDDSDTIDWSK